MRNGQPYDITPEESKLREEGFLSVATTELMRSEGSEYKDFIEKEYNEVVLSKRTQQQLANSQQPIKTLNMVEQPKPLEKPQYIENPIPFDVAEALRSGISILGSVKAEKQP